MPCLITCVLIIAAISLTIKKINKYFNILAGCRRFRTVDGTDIETKATVVPGRAIFGNNFDFFGLKADGIFRHARRCWHYAKTKGYILYFFNTPVYNATHPEDANEIFKSETLTSKSHFYDVLTPFLGLGLLNSNGKLWHSRRKLLTPTIHFNILTEFVAVFKEESYKFITQLKMHANEKIILHKYIPRFTLNTVCETMMGVKLDEIPGGDEYRKTVNSLEAHFLRRFLNPILHYKLAHFLFNRYFEQRKLLNIAHNFSERIIEKKRQEFRTLRINKNQSDEHGKKKRYAMLDTLLEAETSGLIDHQGICDEVNTFMFEGYDTTSVCLTFALLNLASKPDMQEKCYQEIKDLDDISELSIFEFNKLEYLERVIKEVLRLYPSVPYIVRQTMTETTLNGLVIPKGGHIAIHIFDIMRDPKHFPNPKEFDPDRFLPHNTINRHPFAFVPFSAGPRNCIGQKFAMLEVKVLLVAIIKNFKLLPVTPLEDIVFEAGMLLRTKNHLEIQIIPRD